VLSDAVAGPYLLFLSSPASAGLCLINPRATSMPPTDDVYLFGNDDNGDALFNAAFSNNSIYRPFACSWIQRRMKANI